MDHFEEKLELKRGRERGLQPEKKLETLKNMEITKYQMFNQKCVLDAFFSLW